MTATHSLTSSFRLVAYYTRSQYVDLPMLFWPLMFILLLGLPALIVGISAGATQLEGYGGEVKYDDILSKLI